MYQAHDFLNRVLIKIIGRVNVEIFWLYFKFLCSGKIEGLEYLPKAPYIMAANHVSYLDWIFLQALYKKMTNQKIVFISKKRLFEHSYFRYLVSYNQSICVSNDTFDKEVFNNINKTLEEGKVLGIFPEGRRSEDGKMIKAQNGIAIIALLYGFPIVPVGLTGLYEALPKGKFLPKPNKCTIKIGPPLFFQKNVENAFSDENLLRITTNIMQEIGALAGQTYTY